MSPELTLYLRIAERDPRFLTQPQIEAYWRAIGSPTFTAQDKLALSTLCTNPRLTAILQSHYARFLTVFGADNYYAAIYLTWRLSHELAA